jgi:hypothetical protein
MPKRPGGWRISNLLGSFTSKKQKKADGHENKSDKENVWSSPCFDYLIASMSNAASVTENSMLATVNTNHLK